MKIVYEHHQIELIACGTVCDRCGEVQRGEPEAEDRPAQPPLVR